jgi:cytochrome c oxidase cbb3-type subunit 1
MTPIPFDKPAPVAETDERCLTPEEIDVSCRWPVSLLFVSSVMWLLIGLSLALIASIKLHAPAFLTDCAMLTAGRVRPAAMNALLYGFASQAGIGLMLWLLCRLGGIRLTFQAPIIIAGKVWNLGVTIGVIAILAGASTGFEWLEMPRYASPFLFVGYLLIGLCAVATFAMRRDRALYVSQWYLLGAIFWFPWIYSAANFLLVFSPVRGAFQSVVNAWFTGNFLNLWLASIGLAGIFYFLPKLTGRPLYSQQIAAFAFWTMALFGNWSGPASLLDGPVPRWIGSIGTVANVGLLLSVAANAMNWNLTYASSREESHRSVELRFVLFGAVAYLVAGVVSAAMSLPSISNVTNLTYATAARNYLVLLGFVSMVLFAAIYYVTPRLFQVSWASESLRRAHFLASAIGIAITFVALMFGGISQGWKLANPNIPFLTIMKGTIPFVGVTTLGLTVLMLGQIAFALNLGRLLRVFCEPICKEFCAEVCGCLPTAKQTQVGHLRSTEQL